jgi:hypothetical protein
MSSFQLGSVRIEPGVLRVEFLDALEFGCIESPVFALPLVEARLTDAALEADVGDFLSGIGFLADRDDLRLGGSASSHAGWYPSFDQE